MAEVLISLLAMSIAVVSVATLFPLSLLRSVQARQLTKATVLRYNAENKLTIHPGLLSPGNPPAGIPVGANVVVDPLGWHSMREINANPAAGAAPFPTAIANRFGNYSATGPPPGNFDRRPLRIHGGFGNETFPPPPPLPATNVNTTLLAQSRRLVTLPDSWIESTRGVPNYTPATPSITMPSDVDLTGIPWDPQGTISRVIVFDATARFSDVRAITAIDVPNRIITLSAPLSPRVLSGAAVPGPGEARIQIKEQRYTWLLTVRSAVHSADIVVFFRRALSSVEDELIYPTQFLPVTVGPDGQPGRAGIDDNNNNQIDEQAELGFPGSDDFNRIVRLQWNTPERPPIHRGGYIFDVQNALWYRIQNIQNETGNSADLVLNDFIKARGDSGVMIMQGVIDVYPISY